MWRMPEHAVPTPPAGYEHVASSSLAGIRSSSSSRGGSSGTSSSSSGEGSGKQQEEELLRTLRMLLQRGRWEAAVHILRQEYTANGQRLKDEALR